jgi:hypothetical protein
MNPRPLVVSAILAATASIPVLWAADTGAASQPTTPVTAAAARPANATPHLFSFDFRGGTLAELLAGNSGLSDASVFILNKDGITINGTKVSNVAKVDMTTVIPPFSIHDATPENIVRAFNAAMAPYGLSLVTNGTAFLLMAGKLPSPSSDTASTSTLAAKPGTPSINIDFPGGSIAQLVAQINTSESGPFNLIGEKKFQETPLPPFSLRNTEPASLAVGLNGLLRPSELAISLAGQNIFVLTKSVSPSSPFTTTAQTFQAFQLAPYLATLSVEEITDAILVAWESAPDHDPKQLRFKFHPATKLLFVYGPPEAIAIATQLVPQLDPAATTRARLESYRSSGKSAQTVLNPSVQDEARRLDAVTQEVLRRREAREAGKAAVPPLENK